MLEPYTPEIRRELAAFRMAALRHSARPAHVGPVRRTIGNLFVRLGVLVGSDGTAPPSAAIPGLPEAPAHAGASTVLRSVRRAEARTTVPATWDDIARELAAPYGLRTVDPLSRTRSRFGSRPGAPSARSRGSRRPARFDAR